jgi:O-antigen/teichoic acid export membrane protein
MANGGSPLRQIFHGSLWYGLAIVVNRFLPGILTIVLAWWLEQRELGAVSFVLAYYSVLLVGADWSIAYSLQKLIPENSARAGQVGWTALFVRLAFSTALGGACWVLDAATGMFHGYGWLLGMMLIASALGTIVYIYNARCEFAKGSLFSMGVYLLWLPLALVLVKLGFRIIGPLIALCISFAGIGLPGFLLSPVLRGRAAFLRPIAREILRFGGWATLATLFSGFADQVGILVVAYAIGDTQAGIFKVAATFGVLPALLGMIVVLPLMPVAKQGLLNGEDVSADLVLPILRYLFMFGLAIAAAGFVLAPAIIRTFVRESYLSAVWPLRVLLAANLFRMLVTALSGFLFVGHGLKALAKIHGTVAALGVVGSLLVVRASGITGVSAALLMAWIAGAFLLYHWFQLKAPLRLEWGRYLRYGGSAAVMAMAVFLAARVLHPPGEQFVLGASVALVVYAFLLWMQRDIALRELVSAVRPWTTQ